MPNSTELSIDINLQDSNNTLKGLNDNIAKLTSAIENLGNKPDPFRRTTEGAAHAVTALQALSGGIRTFEGNLTNNIRAVERFLASFESIAALAQKVFPFVGLVSLGGVIFEAYERLKKFYDMYRAFQDATRKMNDDFAKLTDTVRTTNAQLQVTNDKLDNQIAKLQHRPQNLLKLALDEAALSASELTKSLRAAYDEEEKLIKEHGVSAIGGFITRQTSTSDIEETQRAFKDRLTRMANTARSAADAASGNPERQAGILNNGITDREEAIRARNRSLNSELDSAKKAQAAYFSYQAEQRQRLGLGPDALILSGPTNESKRIALLEDLIAHSSERATEIVNTQANKQKEVQLKKAEEINEGMKSLLAERLRIQEQAQHDLTAAIEKSGDPMYKIYAQYNDRVFTAQGKKGDWRDFGRSYSDIRKAQGYDDGQDFGSGAIKYTPALTGGMTTASSVDQFRARQLDAGTLAQQNASKYMGALDSIQTKQDEIRTKALDSQRNFENETLQHANDQTIQEYSFRQEKLNEWQTTQLKALDSLNAQTVEQKLRVEQQKLTIEKSYIDQSLKLELAKLDALEIQEKAQAEGDALRLIASGPRDARGNVDSAYSNQQNDLLRQRIDVINDSYDRQRQIQQGKSGIQIDEAVDKASKAQTQVIQERYKTTYDTILKDSNSFLEAIEDRSANAWKRIADSFKKSFLDAFNNVISSAVARQLANFITGESGSGANGKKGGLIMGGGGGAGGILGSIFGSGGGVSAGGVMGTPPFVANGGGGGSYGPSLGSLFGAGSGGVTVGGTPSFIPAGLSGADAANLAQLSAPLGNAPSGGVGGLFGALGGIFNGKGGGSSLGMAAGGIALLSSLGQKGAGGLTSALGGGGALGYNFAKLASTNSYLKNIFPHAAGAGGAVAGAAAGIGLGLFTQGVTHTGWKGFGESLGGGALTGAGLGFMVGGPMGALIGGAIGAGAGLIGGLVSLFRESPRDKVKRIVKQAYGIQIDDGMADSIAQIAKDQFGNNVAVAVNSAQVRQMIALYAQATNNGALANQISPQMTPYTVSSSGGVLTNIAGTTNGFPSTNFGGTVPTVMPGSGQLTVKLDGPQTTSLFSGLATQVAPAAVQSSYSSNASRLTSASALFQPGLVTR